MGSYEQKSQSRKRGILKSILIHPSIEHQTMENRYTHQANK